MDQPAPVDKTAMGCALRAGGSGLFDSLLSLGVIHVSGGGSPQGSTWLGMCIGLAFFAGGLALIVQTIERVTVAPDGDLSAGTPTWARVAMHGLALMVTVCLAAIGLWAAFGPGPRQFTSNIPFVGQRISEPVGRPVFGAAAVVRWLRLV